MGYYFNAGWSPSEEPLSLNDKALKELFKVLLMTDEELDQYMDKGVEDDTGDSEASGDSEFKWF